MQKNKRIKNPDKDDYFLSICLDILENIHGKFDITGVADEDFEEDILSNYTPTVDDSGYSEVHRNLHKVRFLMDKIISLKPTELINLYDEIMMACKKYDKIYATLWHENAWTSTISHYLKLFTRSRGDVKELVSRAPKFFISRGLLEIVVNYAVLHGFKKYVYEVLYGFHDHKFHSAEHMESNVRLYSQNYKNALLQTINWILNEFPCNDEMFPQGMIEYPSFLKVAFRSFDRVKQASMMQSIYARIGSSFIERIVFEAFEKDSRVIDIKSQITDNLCYFGEINSNIDTYGGPGHPGFLLFSFAGNGTLTGYMNVTNVGYVSSSGNYQYYIEYLCNMTKEARKEIENDMLKNISRASSKNLANILSGSDLLVKCIEHAIEKNPTRSPEKILFKLFSVDTAIPFYLKSGFWLLSEKTSKGEMQNMCCTAQSVLDARNSNYTEKMAHDYIEQKFPDFINFLNMASDGDKTEDIIKNIVRNVGVNNIVVREIGDKIIWKNITK